MQVYADNAATTKMSKVAIDAMLPYFETVYGNPSSLHSLGQEAKEALEEARKKGNPRSALRYLESMVDKGYLSEEERAEIYYLYLGYEDIIGKELPLSVNPGLVAK